MGKFIFKNIYKAHVYAGIFVAVHFAIFSVSGLVLLFKDEIQGTHTSHVLAPKKDKSEIARGYETALANAMKEYPNDRPLAVYSDEHDENILGVLLGIDGAKELRGARRASFDLISGAKIVEEPPSSSGFFDWVLRLHRELLLGPGGKFYVGFVGLIYVFMLLSGFFIYGKFMKGRSFGNIRQALIPKLVDFHKFVGVLTFGWGLIVGLSGVFLAFNGLLIFMSLKPLLQKYQGFQSPTGKATPFSKAVETALHTRPDFVISYISFPDTEYGIPGHYLMLMNGTDAITKRINHLAVINYQTAALAEVADLPLYLKLVFLSEPLHFGNYGGIFLKIIWAVFTVCSLAVACFGVAAFFGKRKQRKTQTVLPTSTKETGRYPQVSDRVPYGIPVLLAATTGLGITCSLFTKGVIAQISMSVLLIPLFLLVSRVVFRRKKDP